MPAGNALRAIQSSICFEHFTADQANDEKRASSSARHGEDGESAPSSPLNLYIGIVQRGIRISLCQCIDFGPRLHGERREKESFYDCSAGLELH